MNCVRLTSSYSTRARCASACAVLRRNAKDVSSARSASLISNAAKYRPAIPDPPEAGRVWQV
jgi:hypothetical protein